MKLSYSRALQLVVLASLFHIASEREALAYLDPGSASYTLQMVIAAVVAAGFALKTYWAKIKSLFARPQADEATDESTSSDAPSL
jgi:hypothetical protein